MTEMVTVRLILYGLIAFVPNDSSPTSIQALLVDAQGHHYASDGCKLPSHVPALYVKAAKCTVHPETGTDGREPCDLSEDVPSPVEPGAASGSWLLNKESLSLEVEPPRRKKLVAVRNTEQLGLLPTTPEEATNLAWLQSLPGSIDRNCLGTADDCPIVARFLIDDGEVTTCSLIERPRIGVIPAFQMMTIGASKAPLNAPTQALSSAVLASFQVPRGYLVRLVSRPFAGSCSRPLPPTRIIELDAETQSNIDIWVTNEPRNHDLLEQGDHACHSEEIDRHYELYYNLLSERVPFAQRLVPHRQTAAVTGGATGAQPTGDKHCPVLKVANRIPGNWLACSSVWVQGTGGS